MAFNQRERVSIRERDFRFGRRDNPVPGCQFPHDAKDSEEVPCDGELQVHHILPQRFGAVWLHAVKEELDREINALTICESSHVRSTMGIHTDQAEAYQTYGENKQAFSEMFKKRDELTKQGVPYWNTVFDARLHYQAQRNTETAEEHGWRFKKPSKQFQKTRPDRMK